MKTLKIVLCTFLLLFLTQVGFAQVKTASFKVAGECGMCKKKIETAAKQAGASYALWNVDSKQLTVKYQSASATPVKIQQGIAAVGYDTPSYKATDEAYNNLHECCKYDRTAKGTCCDGAGCSSEECKKCCADGKCASGTDCCKDGKCEMKKESTHSANGMAASCCKKA